MQDLYNMEPMSVQLTSYPMIITMQEDGTMYFTTLDFPAIFYEKTDFQEGIHYIKERIEEKLLINPMPPVATPINQIPIVPNQMVVHVVYK